MMYQDNKEAYEEFDWLFSDEKKHKKKKKHKKHKKKKLKDEIKLKAADTCFNTMSDIAKMYAYNKIFLNIHASKIIEPEDCTNINKMVQISDKMKNMR
jgi:hypothetical protein